MPARPREAAKARRCPRKWATMDDPGLNWLLRLYTTQGPDGAAVQVEASDMLEESRRLQKNAWERADPGRAAQAAAIRERYLAERAAERRPESRPPPPPTPIAATAAPIAVDPASLSHQHTVRLKQAAVNRAAFASVQQAHLAASAEWRERRAAALAGVAR